MEPQVFFADELTAQELAGGGASGTSIRDHMPDQHRNFFATLPYLAVSTSSADGWPSATLLAGTPGFVQSPDPRKLDIALSVDGSDPLTMNARSGEDIAVLGIDLESGRRNRANGVLTAISSRQLTIAVRQSFGNCRKYIRRHRVAPLSRAPEMTECLTTLDRSAQQLIERSECFFVASRSRGDAGPQGGADISYRGGPPGFVQIGNGGLVIPDYSGNRYFNTFGNLLGQPRCALLFLDFERGDLLELRGIAAIEWNKPAHALEGTERLWHFQFALGWRRRAALPLQWTSLDE